MVHSTNPLCNPHLYYPIPEPEKLTDHFANSILAKANGRTQVEVQDIAECAEMFLDARRSAALLAGEAGKAYIS
ncbi:hypothetical protein IMZ48_03645 [Candidatus Bathyarchaeota archaeon]|nr:hypothetical protein [Candidatus Bathyarchaeota archaeon]